MSSQRNVIPAHPFALQSEAGDSVFSAPTTVKNIDKVGIQIDSVDSPSALLSIVIQGKIGGTVDSESSVDDGNWADLDILPAILGTATFPMMVTLTTVAFEYIRVKVSDSGAGGINVAGYVTAKGF